MNDQSTTMNQQQHHPPLMHMNQSSTNTNRLNQRQQMNPSYTMWLPPPPLQQFRNPNSVAGAVKAPPSSFKKSLAPRSNWKGKIVNNKALDRRRMPQKESLIRRVNPSLKNFDNVPMFNEMQFQNSMKTQFSQKRIFHNNNNSNRYAPFAPRNTTSFIIRSKKCGGLAPLVSPCAVTPSVLPTPVLSPLRELLVDMAKEEWGVDGYGSMTGLIRLRSSPDHEMEEDEEGGSGGSDVEEHAEVEKRLDHDLSRFEMVSNPNGHNDLLENRVDDQDAHIAKLEEDNLNLKEKLFFMERAVGDLRRRMLCLERARNGGEEISGGEVVENELVNESDCANSSEEVINNDEGEVGNEDEHEGEVGNGDEHNVGVEINVNENETEEVLKKDYIALA